jgi:hypothetical protein
MQMVPLPHPSSTPQAKIVAAVAPAHHPRPSLHVAGPVFPLAICRAPGRRQDASSTFLASHSTRPLLRCLLVVADQKTPRHRLPLPITSCHSLTHARTAAALRDRTLPLSYHRAACRRTRPLPACRFPCIPDASIAPRRSPRLRHAAKPRL